MHCSREVDRIPAHECPQRGLGLGIRVLERGHDADRLMVRVPLRVVYLAIDPFEERQEDAERPVERLLEFGRVPAEGDRGEVDEDVAFRDGFGNAAACVINLADAGCVRPALEAALAPGHGDLLHPPQVDLHTAHLKCAYHVGFAP
jgi:hypothetical protein